MNEQQQSQNTKSEYELKREQKLAEQKRRERNHLVKRALKIGAVIALVGGSIGSLIGYVATRPPVPENEIISRGGIHWHPELAITVKGQKQEIPANLGFGAIHQPVHTHDSTGVLHLEIQGLVRKDNTQLGRFFKIWGKEFNSNCIFDNCNGPEGKVTMMVNGKENTEFDHYEMKDKDKIEIQYDKSL